MKKKILWHFVLQTNSILSRKIIDDMIDFIREIVPLLLFKIYMKLIGGKKR